MKNIEAIANIAANKARIIQRKFFDQKLDVSFKGATDLLTQVDLKSQSTIIQTIRKQFKHHRFLAEENNHGHNIDFEGPVWIIDPLDGTTNYAHRLPLFAISIAFALDGQLQFALIDAPKLNQRFTAIKNKGAFLNGKRIFVSKTKKLQQSLLVTGFPYDKRKNKNNNLKMFSHFELKSLAVRRLGAAALDLAYVACGKFDGFWEPKLKPWDIAAGVLLVKEAGGKVSNFEGKDLSDLWSKEIVASNGLIHSSITRVTRRHRIS